MPLPRTATRALAGVCALTLLLAACGGDDDEGSGTDDTEQTTASTEAEGSTDSTEAEESTASEPEEETTTSEAEGDPEAVATAEAINLQIEDFAEGWVEEEASDDGEGNIDECFTTVDVAATTVGEADSPTFSAETPDGQGAQVVQMQTVVFDSPETASALLAEVAMPEFASCVQSTLAEDSVEGTEAALAPTVDDPPLAEESVGLAGAVQIPDQDGAVQEGRLDLHAIRTAEVASFTMTLDVGATPATGFEQTLAELYTVIADRQAAEVG